MPDRKANSPHRLSADAEEKNNNKKVQKEKKDYGKD